MLSWRFIIAYSLSVLIGLILVMFPEKSVTFLKSYKKELGFLRKDSTDELWLPDHVMRFVARIWGILIILFVSVVFYVAVKYTYP
jgi:hypothetical protein